jgi:hypothetical protein
MSPSNPFLLEHITVTEKQAYTPTDREKAFLETVEETRYEREIINGLAPFFNDRAPEDMLTFYNEGEWTSSRC